MIFLPPLLIGFIFEVLSSPKFGFYFLTALLMSSIYYALPFVFPWLNILIAFVSGFIFSFIWSWLIAGMRAPSYSYDLHIFIYLSLIAVSIYIVQGLEQKK